MENNRTLRSINSSDVLAITNYQKIVTLLKRDKGFTQLRCRLINESQLKVQGVNSKYR